VVVGEMAEVTLTRKMRSRNTGPIRYVNRFMLVHPGDGLNDWTSSEI
jgi:hypothetical protein